MQFKDLREFIRALEETGEIKIIEGASCDLEIGGVSQIAAESPKSPALLFDSIKEFPKGHRMLTNAISNRHRERLIFDVPEDLSDKEAVKYWKEKIKEYKPIAPQVVAAGAVKENELLDDKVDLNKIPWPKWHEQNERCSAYGTVFAWDPESNNIHAVSCSLGLLDHRAMVADVPWTSVDAPWNKYWSHGKACPVAISLGHDPALLVAASMKLPLPSSPYDFAGWLRGAPVEVMKSEYAGVPIPAAAEVVLEGDLLPPEQRKEGAGSSVATSGKWKAPYVNVKGMHFRNDPIIIGNPPFLGGCHGVLA
ncbi:MAG: UbiD family decarboxylase domain-containing protein, partial [Candidatus Binatia bacterium]